jgi:uncharacterized protein YbcI
MKAKTYALDDVIVVVMRGSGFTPLEQTIVNAGQPERVIAMREDFQRVMAPRYKDILEALTGHQVLAFMSQTQLEPDITVETFVIDGPLERLSADEPGMHETSAEGAPSESEPRTERVRIT